MTYKFKDNGGIFMPNNSFKCSILEKEILDIENEIKELQNELFAISTADTTEITRKINSLRIELRVKNSELTKCRP